MSEADFALQWLKHQGNAIYNKGKRVLVYEGDPNYKIPKLETGIVLGADIDEEEDGEKKYLDMSLKELDCKGMAVKFERRLELLWRERQMGYYRLMRKRPASTGLSYEAFHKAISRGNITKIEHDPSNRRCRLIGENVLAGKGRSKYSGIGEWTYYEKIVRRTSPREGIIGEISKDEILEMVEHSMLSENVEDVKNIIKIREIPLLISNEKYIVCMKKEDICQRILCTGKARKGKSTFVNGVAGHIKLKWNDCVGWMIDPQNQFYDISLPQQYDQFIRVLDMINETPCPMPAVHLYLACKEKNIIRHNNISFKLTLNFLEFLNKYSFYGYGIPSWRLEKAERYLRRIIPYIKDAKDYDDFEKKMYKALPEAEDKEGLKSMIFKWANTFNTIFNENFTSNLYEDDDSATDTLGVIFKDGRRMKGHPFIILMEAGVMPIINTSVVPEKTWVRNYMADLMQKTMKHQKIMGIRGYRQRFFIIVDEMQAVYEMRSGKKMDACSMSYEALFRQGGFNDIGFVGNTQSLEKLNPEMVKNANYICCVQTQSDAERKIIQKIFDLPKEITNQLGELKTQEIMIFSNEGFVTYDIRTGKRKEVVDRKWFRGKIVPPVNYHKSPTITGGNDDTNKGSD